MKREILKPRMALFFVLWTFFNVVLTNGTAVQAAGPHGPNGGNTGSVQSIYLLPAQDLDENEVNAILWMREEEKLARDVYLTLQEKWNLTIFGNIADSEQMHMDMVKDLIQKYNLDDPVIDDSIGTFTQSGLRDLYELLVTKGSSSIIDALRVGATIEDLDIKDLDERIEETDNDDIKQVFDNLRQGSYNHLNAFVSALNSYGETYEAQYISEEELAEILNDDQNSSSSNNVIMLPSTTMTFSEQEKATFSLTPHMAVLAQHQGKIAQLYALIYSYDLDKWFAVKGSNLIEELDSSEAISPFSETYLNNEVEFPIFPDVLNLTGLTGEFDVYYGYRTQDGELVYSLEKLIFE